jgi:hypothetical protein
VCLDAGAKNAKAANWHTLLQNRQIEQAAKRWQKGATNKNGKVEASAK